MIPSIKNSICVTFLLLYLFVQSAYSIDCFKCISTNNSYSACEDPFHNNVTVDMLESPCLGGRKGRDGLYPATSCIKINGMFDNGETIMVRGCALDSGSLTTDTELVRLSHCGSFKYGTRYAKGCVQSCNDVDACNNSDPLSMDKLTAIISSLLISMTFLII